jgi:hypothetical protein
MANLNINITRPTISLITRVRESQNKCEKVLTFTIKSTPNATIDLMGFIVDEAPIGAFTDDYIRDFSVDKGSGFVRVPNVTSLPSGIIASDGKYYRHLPFSLNSTGEAKVRMILENNGSSFLNSSKARVIVSDTTNNKVATKTFINYSTNVRCQLGLEPEAVDDIYDVSIDRDSTLNILKNDIRVTNSSYSLITIEQQPAYGTIEVRDKDVIYTPVSAVDGQSDTFTYSVETLRGYSNIATVTLNTVKEVIDNNTKINVFFDGSGSMENTLPILQSMVDNELKTKLLTYYNSSVDYEEKVKVINMGVDERFLKHINNKLDYTVNNIFLIFQNESAGHYQTGTADDTLRPEYVTDIDAFHDNLNSNAPQFNAVMFQVDSGDDPAGFKRWLGFVKNGEDNYSGNKGLSNIDTFTIRNDVFGTIPDGASGQYYTDLIVEELNKLGFEIT